MLYTVFNYKGDETYLYLVIYHVNVYWIPTACWESICVDAFVGVRRRQTQPPVAYTLMGKKDNQIRK